MEILNYWRKTDEIKVETNNLDVYKKICEILGIDTQEELMELGGEESTFTNEVTINIK
mgnify:CR=1 FL=1